MGWANTYAVCWHRLDGDEVTEYERMLDKDFPKWEQGDAQEVIAALESIAEEQRKVGNRRPDAPRYPRIKSAIIAARYERRKGQSQDEPTEGCALCSTSGLISVRPGLPDETTMAECAIEQDIAVPCLCSRGQRLMKHQSFKDGDAGRLRALARKGIAQHASITRDAHAHYAERAVAVGSQAMESWRADTSEEGVL